VKVNGSNLTYEGLIPHGENLRNPFAQFTTHRADGVSGRRYRLRQRPRARSRLELRSRGRPLPLGSPTPPQIPLGRLCSRPRPVAG
jgi:hypothetical protein